MPIEHKNIEYNLLRKGMSSHFVASQEDNLRWFLNMALKLCVPFQHYPLQYKAAMDSRCRQCRQQPFSRLRYVCCSARQFYCYNCSSKPCKNCSKIPKIQMDSSMIDQSRREKQLAVSRFRSCADCRRTESISDYEYFYQPQCKYYFCYRCILSLYDKYVLTLNQIAKQTGIRPDYPFELPCGCQLSETQALQFLQKSCFCCGKKTQASINFRLKNNMRVMEKCLTGSRYMSAAEKLKLRQIDQMILKCDGCDAPLTEVLPNHEQLNVCRRCFDLNKSQVQALEMRQRRRQAPSQKPLAPLKESRKLKSSQEKAQLKGQRNEIYKEQENAKRSHVVEQGGNIQVTQQLLSKLLKNGTALKASQKGQQSSSSLKESLEQIRPDSNAIQRKDCLKQLEQEPLQNRNAAFSNQIFKKMIQCSQCCIFLRQCDRIFFSAEKTDCKQDQKQTKQSAKDVRNLCRLCYCKEKQKVLSSAHQRSFDEQQNLYKSRLYKSTSKPEKRPEKKYEPKNNNIFSKFDYLYEPSFAAPITKTTVRPQAQKKIQPNIPNSQIKSLLNEFYNYQKCKGCGETIIASQLYKKQKKCRNCEAKEKADKQLETFCKFCGKLKRLKQSEVGKNGQCKECLLKPVSMK